MYKKLSIKDIAGVVVLYNSPYEVINNIKTYISQIDLLYIVDNSKEPNRDLINDLLLFPNATYKSLGGNKGIAAALNWAARQAVQDGYTLLLTMDDDTQTPNDMIVYMLEFWNQYSEPIGILSGVHQTGQTTKRSVNNNGYKILMYTLTSGNLLNLNAYREIGEFNDDLFIDHVDHEYGLRLTERDYQVIELLDLDLIHKLGYRQEIRFKNFIIKTYGTHPPIRLYYFVRNGIYLSLKYFKQYPSFTWMVLKELFKRTVKGVVLDNNKLERIKMLTRGVKDGLTGKLGKYF